MVRSIKKMQRDFLWELGEKRRDHLLNWDIVCMLVEKEGLGLRKLSIRNDAFLAKWLWRFPCEDGSMWHSIIATKYGMGVNGWDSNAGGRVLIICP